MFRVIRRGITVPFELVLLMSILRLRRGGIRALSGFCQGGLFVEVERHDGQVVRLRAAAGKLLYFF